MHSSKKSVDRCCQHPSYLAQLPNRTFHSPFCLTNQMALQTRSVLHPRPHRRATNRLSTRNFPPSPHPELSQSYPLSHLELHYVSVNPHQPQHHPTMSPRNLLLYCIAHRQRQKRPYPHVSGFRQCRLPPDSFPHKLQILRYPIPFIWHRLQRLPNP